MGAIFVAGQVLEYATLVAEGRRASAPIPTARPSTSRPASTALHVTGGLIAFLIVIGRGFAVKNFGHREATSAIVVSYYWHFVDVVWIGLFLVIYLLPN